MNTLFSTASQLLSYSAAIAVGEPRLERLSVPRRCKKASESTTTMSIKSTLLALSAAAALLAAIFVGLTAVRAATLTLAAVI